MMTTGNPMRIAERYAKRLREAQLLISLMSLNVKVKKHAFHRKLVSTERRAQMEYEQNVHPLIVEKDFDFSENGSLNRFPAICSGRRSNKIGFGGPKRATEQYHTHRKIVFPRICNG